MDDQKQTNHEPRYEINDGSRESEDLEEWRDPVYKEKKDRRSSIKKVIVLLLAFFIIAVTFFVPIMHMFEGPFEFGRVYPETADFTIKRNLRFENEGPGEMNYNLTLTVPRNITEQNIQLVHDMRTDPEPGIYQKRDDHWKSWDRNLEAGRTEEIEIEYDVQTTTVHWDHSGDEAGNVEDIPEELKDRYNRDQWDVKDHQGNHLDRNGDGRLDVMIEPEHPEIREKAETIVQDEDNIYDKSRAIYDWIDENIEYEIGREGEKPKHAYWVYDSRTGDCDEQTNLYASFSRAVGIPAWLELGVLHDRVRDSWGGHGWVRTIYVDDAGDTEFVNIDTVNDQFYFRDAHRLTTWVDDGEEGALGDFYQYVEYSGGSLVLEDDFENLRMDTEGSVRSPEHAFIPGFGSLVAIPAILISLVIYHFIKKSS